MTRRVKDRRRREMDRAIAEYVSGASVEERRYLLIDLADDLIDLASKGRIRYDPINRAYFAFSFGDALCLCNAAIGCVEAAETEPAARELWLKMALRYWRDAHHIFHHRLSNLAFHEIGRLEDLLAEEGGDA